jgi:hypothetical protein
VVTANHCYSYHQGFVKQAGTPGGIVDTRIIPSDVAFLPCAISRCFAVPSWQ